MPKRTNAFQSLVLQLTRQLQPLGAKIEESRFLLDKTNGGNREVDVVIELQSGPHALIISIECFSQQRRATVEWVDAMHGKHLALSTNKLVLVSESGFTQPALTKARSYGYDAMTVQDAARADWHSVVDIIPHLGIRATMLPKVKKILLNLQKSEWERAKAISNFVRLLIILPGKQPTRLTEYVESLLHSPGFTDQAEQAFPVNTLTSLQGTIVVPSQTEVVDSDLGTFALQSIYVEAEYQRIQTSLPIERYAYGDKMKVAMGRGNVDGFPVTMTVSQEQGGQPEVRVRFQTSIENQQLTIVSGRLVADTQ